VFDRWREVGDYRPANLAAWAQGHGTDVAELRGSRRADDLNVVPTQGAGASPCCATQSTSSIEVGE
jgi:hypothetical protein